jgi:hypothetical protein
MEYWLPLSDYLRKHLFPRRQLCLTGSPVLPLRAPKAAVNAKMEILLRYNSSISELAGGQYPLPVREQQGQKGNRSM